MDIGPSYFIAQNINLPFLLLCLEDPPINLVPGGNNNNNGYVVVRDNSDDESDADPSEGPREHSDNVNEDFHQASSNTNESSGTSRINGDVNISSRTHSHNVEAENSASDHNLRVSRCAYIATYIMIII